MGMRFEWFDARVAGLEIYVTGDMIGDHKVAADGALVISSRQGAVVEGSIDELDLFAQAVTILVARLRAGDVPSQRDMAEHARES